MVPARIEGLPTRRPSVFFVVGILFLVPSMSACAQQPVSGLVPIRGWNDKISECSYVAFTPDSKLAISAGALVVIWDVASGKEIQRFQIRKVGMTGQGIAGFALSRDGRYALSGLHEKPVKLWDLNTGKMMQEYSSMHGHVYAAAFSPDGRYAAWGTGRFVRNPKDRDYGEFFIQVWDIKKNVEVAGLGTHSGPILALAFTPDGKRLLSASSDRSIRLWDIKTAKEIKRSTEKPRPTTETYEMTLAISPDGRHFLIGDLLWDMIAWKRLRRAKPEDDSWAGNRRYIGIFSPDGDRALSA